MVHTRDTHMVHMHDSHMLHIPSRCKMLHCTITETPTLCSTGYQNLRVCQSESCQMFGYFFSTHLHKIPSLLTLKRDL